MTSSTSYDVLQTALFCCLELLSANQLEESSLSFAKFTQCKGGNEIKLKQPDQAKQAIIVWLPNCVSLSASITREFELLGRLLLSLVELQSKFKCKAAQTYHNYFTSSLDMNFEMPSSITWPYESKEHFKLAPEKTISKRQAPGSPLNI